MKLSIEAKDAASVGAGFMALTVGAIAQGRSEDKTGGHNNYGPTNNPGVNTNMSQQGYNSSPPGRTTAEENRQKFSDEQQAATTPKKAASSKTAKSRKHHTERTRTETNAPGE